jgi:hypothetical protein
MIKEAYVSFETAKLLKEKGFNEPCKDFYRKENEEWLHRNTYEYNYFNLQMPRWEDCYSCPTLQMAMKWLREEKRTSIIIEFDVTKRGYCPYVHQLDYDMDWVVKWRINIPMKYEEAVEVALKYTLENLI